MQKPFTLIFKYDPSGLEKSIPEKSLKLAYSSDGKKWNLTKAKLNTQRKEISLVTKNSGYYMIVGGGYSIAAASGVQGAGTEKNDLTSLPTPIPKPQQSETPKPQKKCLWIFCW